MPRVKSVRVTTSQKSLKTLAAALLLLLYLVGNTSSGILHQLFHERQTAVSHSRTQEKDLCHRAIYHFGKDPKHNSHFAVSEKSDKCHLFSHTEQISVRNLSSECCQPNPLLPEGLTHFQFSNTYVPLPSRAPPLV